MQVVEAGTPLTELDLRRLEKELGFALPGDYRAFLAEHNGGRPDPNGFRLQDGSDESLVDGFFSISGPNRSSRLEQVLDVYRGRIPNGLLPVADDQCGNLICIWCAGPNIGQIEFWDHEFEADEGESPGTDNLSVIATSFREFIDGLYEYVDEEEP